MADKELDLWLRRAEAVARAQERYLWLLLISGVFFWALDPAQSRGSTTINIPVLNLPVRPDVVWAVGPFVLGFLLVATIGSLKAFGTVKDALQAAHITPGVPIDTAPNALDFAFHTTPESRVWVRRIFLFAYPVYFAVFASEALYLLVRQVLPWWTGPEHPILWTLGLVASGWGAVRVIKYWIGNLRRARALQ